MRDEDKDEVVRLAKELDSLGYEIWATRGTSTALWKSRIESNALYRIELGSPNALDLIRLGKVKWIVNTRSCTTRWYHSRQNDGLRAGQSTRHRNCLGGNVMFFWRI